MTSAERDRCIANLFREALKRLGPDRRGYLDEACNELSHDIRAEVERRLAAEELASGAAKGLPEDAPIDSHRIAPLPAEDADASGESLDTVTRPVHRDPIAAVFRGAVLDDRYELVDELGRGGMGVVYRARDTRLDRTVALKFLSPEIAKNDKSRQRFVREARAAAALSHPNICTVYDVWEAEGRPYIAMEYVEGQTLKEKLAERSIPVSQAVDYAAQTAEGLQRAHETGIVHRDIKPANLIVSDSGQLKILDFGLAQLAEASHLTQTGVTFGTVAYMSPEQVRGRAVDHRSDQWSLGVVLYELLAGQRPFLGDNPAAILHSVLHDTPESVGQLRPDVPAALETLVHTMLQKEPDRRYQRISQLRFALRESGPWLPGPSGSSTGSRFTGSETLRTLPGVRAASETTVGDELRAGQRGPERRQVTVLFCRFDSSHEGTKLDPEVLFELVLPYHQACDALIQQFGGHKAPYPGDGLLVYFGYPHAHEDGPERAVRAGLGMIDTVRRLDPDAQSEQTTSLHTHIGIHTGMVVAQGGRDESIRLFGSVPDNAIQLQDRGDADSVVISEATYRLVKNVFPCREIHQGETEYSLRAYKIDSQPAAGSQGHAGLRPVAPLVGRDQEINMLRARWDHASQAMGQVVLLSGEAGIGKSRLLLALHDHVARESGASIVLCRCSAYHANTAFHPFTDWLDRRVLQSERGESTSQRQRRLEEYVEEHGFSREEAVPLLASLLSLPLDPSYAPLRLSPEQRKDKMHHVLLALLLPRSPQQPILLVVEDLHWADPSTRELLALFVDQVAMARTLAVFTFRPPFRPDWPIRSHVTDLSVTRLPRPQVEMLVDSITGGTALPPPLRQQLVSKSDGVPLFVEELTKMVLELRTAGQGQQNDELAGSTPKLAVPATLHDSLMARLDRLGTAKEVAQLAATIGREFRFELIVAVSPWDEITLKRELEQLVQAELLYQRGFPPQSTYWFKHTLIQDTAYQSLLKDHRENYHRQIAAALEVHFPEIATSRPEVLVFHMIASGEEERAVDFLLAAGDKARSLYANVEAEQNYREAVRILKHHRHAERAARTLMKLALVFTAAFEPEKAKAAYEEAFTLWKPLRRSSGPRKSESPGVVLRSASGDPISLDPGRTYDTDSAFLQAQLFEGLVEVGPDQDVVPALASHWEVSDSGKQYTFYLRDDARWSDGRPVLAAHFEYAWKRNLRPQTDSPAAHLLYRIQNARAFREGGISDADRVGVKAVGEQILEVHLEGPTAYLPHLLAHPIAYPLPQWLVETFPHDWTEVERIVTNGGFTLAQWKKGQRLTLRANPHYTGSFPGNVSQIDGLIFTRHIQAVRAYAENELDVSEMHAADARAMIQTIVSHSEELRFGPLLNTNYLVFPTNRPPLDDVRIRHAFAHAVDKDALTRALSHGEHRPATGGFVPAGMPGHSPDVGLPYDPALARRLLADAGYAHGDEVPPITMLHTHGLGEDSFIPLLCQAWKKNLGVTVEVARLDWEQFQRRRQEKQAHLMLSGWVADYPDPDSFLRVVFHSQQGSNEPQWHSDTFDALVERAGEITQPEHRIELYREADRILVAEKAAILPLTYGQLPVLLKPWVTRYPLTASHLRHLKEVVIDPAVRLGP